MQLKIGYVDDHKWIKEQMEKIPQDLRIRAYKKYKEVYESVYNEEPLEHVKIGKARYAANHQLLKIIDWCAQNHN